jgi:CCR4-NOT transcription complex subunit 3
MEQFKACERDSKMKAFSKEGLQMAAADDDGKKEYRQWINKSVKELRNQIDQFESEVEAIPAKKRNTPRVETLQKAVARHNWHIDKLERTLRCLENDTLSTDQVEEIKDSVDYYIENNQVRFLVELSLIVFL